MTSVGQTVEEIREALEGIYHGELNTLNGAMLIGAPTLTYAFANTGIDVGVIVEVDSELMLVQSMVGAPTINVIRGINGTAAAAHVDQSIVRVSPRFTRRRISNAIRAEIRSLPALLFKAESVQVPITSSQRVVRLPRSDLYRILEVRRDPTPSSGSDFFLPSVVSRDTWPLVANARIMRTGPAAQAGWAVELTANVPDGNLYVLYAAPFDTSIWNDGTDLTDEVGLLESMEDIVRWGVLSRLIGEEEALRVDLGEQGQPRVATEVAQGEIPQAANFYLQVRNRRINEEAARLNQLYPARGW